MTRADCAALPRPCPRTGCRYHLASERSRRARSAESCALDVADLGGVTLDQVAIMLGLTRERVRQIEAKGLAKALQAGAKIDLGAFVDVPLEAVRVRLRGMRRERLRLAGERRQLGQGERDPTPEG